MLRKALMGLALVMGLLAAPAHAQDDRPSLLGGGQAVPNFFGATGLLTTPTAYTVGDRGVAAHAYFGSDANSYGFLVGPFSRLEIGGTLMDFDSDTGLGEEFLLNAKFKLLEENIALPGIAVGVTDAFDELNIDPSWYVVASKDLSKTIPLGLVQWKLNFGYGGGIYDDEVFAGAEFNIGTPLDVIPVTRPSFSFITEYANDNVNLGLRGRWRGFSATVGLLDFDDFYGGFSYTTGLRLW